KVPGRDSVRLRFLLGYSLYKRERWAEALPHLEAARKGLPKVADYAAYFRARSLQELGREGESRRAHRELLERHPGSLLTPRARQAIGETLEREGRWREAAAAYRHFLERHPADEAAPGVELRLGEMLERAGQLAEAARAYRSLWLNRPGEPEARVARTREEALASRLPRPLPPPGERELLLRGRALRQLFLYREALAAWDEFERLYPRSPHRKLVRLERALSLFFLRENERALVHLEAFLSGNSPDPARPKAWFFLTRTHLRLGQEGQFLQAVRSLLRESPRSAWAARVRLLLAGHLEEEGRLEEALALYREVARKHPRSRYAERARWKAGWVHYRSGRLEEALRALRGLARDYPNSNLLDDALYWAGRAAERLGRRREAVRSYRETVSRYRHTYYGQLAAEALGGLPGGELPPMRKVDEKKFLPALPSGALDGGEARRLAAAKTLSDLSLFRLSAWEFEALAKFPALAYRAAQAFSRAGLPHRALALMRAHFGEEVVAGGEGLPPGFWQLAYPRRFREKRATRKGPDPLLVNAVIMAESSFDPEVLSPAGAMGLMQLMPATGTRLARRYGVKLREVRDLFEPSVNLDLGARHLAELIEYFGGDLVAALAAYNAGRSAARRWWRRRNRLPLDEFIVRIPYGETRRYLQRVLGYYREYRRIYRRPGSGKP
ncbi:MAG: transglycosylase SLT domain-containing protein, partial [Nitrospinota bacterium]